MMFCRYLSAVRQLMLQMNVHFLGSFKVGNKTDILDQVFHNDGNVRV